MSNSLTKVLTMFIVIMITLLSLLSCDLANDGEVVDSDSVEEFTEKEMENGERSKDKELQEIILSEDDFTLSIDTLPYRGAVLFINYEGEENISDYNLFFDVISNGETKQENMLVEEVDGTLTATIVDMMYLPGDKLDFVIKIQDGSGEVLECRHSETLEHYPWKDWIFDLDEPISLNVPGVNYNFIYDWPNSPNELGAHSSWDFMTRFSDDVAVYSGTQGIVFLVSDYRGEYNVYLYNPYVGAIIQNGHLAGGITLVDGQNIYPGDFLGYIALSSLPHNHYSVIRPFGYTRNINHSSAVWAEDGVPSNFRDYYWPIWHADGGDIFDAQYYQDPYYFHEPTTLGYWYEDTLPDGLKEEMIKIFERDNPEIELPAKEPSSN